MALDSIKAGLKVVTRNRSVAGYVYSVTRHPITRAVLAVLIVPEGVTEYDEFIVTSARNLKAA